MFRQTSWIIVSSDYIVFFQKFYYCSLYLFRYWKISFPFKNGVFSNRAIWNLLFWISLHCIFVYFKSALFCKFANNINLSGNRIFYNNVKEVKLSCNFFSGFFSNFEYQCQVYSLKILIMSVTYLYPLPLVCTLL